MKTFKVRVVTGTHAVDLEDRVENALSKLSYENYEVISVSFANNALDTYPYKALITAKKDGK